MPNNTGFFEKQKELGRLPKFLALVEAGRVELPSENPFARPSTSVAGDLTFPLPISLRQDIGFSSFISPARCKA